MAHKHRHHKKKYYSITDRPSFKIVSSILTAVGFALLYFLIVILMENPGLALICSIPCVVLLIWVAIKQRNFWWVWLLGACPCVVLMVLLRQHLVISFIIETFYWIISYAMCQWLICADSKARHRAKMKRFSHRHHHHEHSHEPRPRDELLEKLFADSE